MTCTGATWFWLCLILGRPWAEHPRWYGTVIEARVIRPPPVSCPTGRPCHVTGRRPRYELVVEDCEAVVARQCYGRTRETVAVTQEEFRANPTGATLVRWDPEAP